MLDRIFYKFIMTTVQQTHNEYLDGHKVDSVKSTINCLKCAHDASLSDSHSHSNLFMHLNVANSIECGFNRSGLVVAN